MHLQEAKQRQAAEEAAKTGEEANDLEKAQDFGRLRTVQVTQARVTGTDTFKALQLANFALHRCQVIGPFDQQALGGWGSLHSLCRDDGQGHKRLGMYRHDSWGGGTGRMLHVPGCPA